MHHFPGREQHALEAGAKLSAVEHRSETERVANNASLRSIFFRFQLGNSLIPYPRNKAARPLDVSGNDSNRDAAECLETG